jgi:hypothetical protein
LGTAPAAPALLHAARLFDGPPGEENAASPAELAPDSVTGSGNNLVTTWTFAGSEKLLLVCTYAGTSAYYRAVIAKVPHACTLHQGPSVSLACS